MVMAAEDQLYYLEMSPTGLAREPGQAGELGPRLTPEPNFPVRSLVRDLTVNVAEGAEETPRVRGWVATTRSLFEFHQTRAGEWRADPLALGGGEPVEVWSHEGEGRGYGRVGLRDGQVLRLPEGLPLTRPLPKSERAVDYATLGGWPVVLGEQGLYATEATQRGNGRPGLLRWVALPLSLKPEALQGARIAVVREGAGEVLYLFTRIGFVYRVGETAR
jgi:hypothetical protein